MLCRPKSESKILTAGVGYFVSGLRRASAASDNEALLKKVATRRDDAVNAENRHGGLLVRHTLAASGGRAGDPFLPHDLHGPAVLPASSRER